MREVSLTEAVSALQHEHVLQWARPINAREEPPKNVIALYVRGVEAEFRSFCFNFIFGDHRIQLA
jgi:hypothetical protein